MKLTHEFRVSSAYYFEGGERVFESGFDDIPRVGRLDVASLLSEAGIAFNPDESEIIYETGQTRYHGPFPMLSAATRDEDGILQFNWGVGDTVSRIIGYSIKGRGVYVTIKNFSSEGFSNKMSEGIEGKVEMETGHLTRVGDAFAAVREGHARILRLEELIGAKMSAYSSAQMDKYVSNMAEASAPPSP